MGIFEDCRAFIFVADYISADASGKLTAIGLGFSISGVQPTGMSIPQHVGVIIDVPAKYNGNEFAVTVELRDDETGKAVAMPGPSGSPEAIRIQQLAKAQMPTIRGTYLPSSLPCRVQAILAFPNGLPLQLGKSYTWKLEIDGQHRKGWEAGFHVAGPPPPPVVGGPIGPSDIGPLPALPPSP